MVSILKGSGDSGPAPVQVKVLVAPAVVAPAAAAAVAASAVAEAMEAYIDSSMCTSCTQRRWPVDSPRRWGLITSSAITEVAAC